ncbi:MAG: VTC domain-containing protein [Clostridia bacterium]|nr:VTC domain-containing protein [Clostridia bacterium]
MSLIRDKLIPDKHGRNTLCSLYLDTPDYLLIRNSIDAVSYKEKLRLRSYGVPNDDKKIFFEIKKKHKGVVYSS